MDSKDQKHNCQNRLLLISAILSFFYYAEAKFQGISIVGANIVFKNENAVIEFTWLIWTYYYLRSYQYYRELGIDGFRDALNRTYVDELGYLLLNLRRDEFKILPSDDPIKSSVIRIGLGYYSNHERNPNEHAWPLTSALVSFFRRIGWKRRRLQPIHVNAPKINLVPHHKRKGYLFRKIRQMLRIPHLRPFRLRAVVYPPTTHFEQQGQHKFYVWLPFSAAIKLIQIHARTMLFRPQFMENQAPLVLGLMPVWYVIALSSRNLHSIWQLLFS